MSFFPSLKNRTVTRLCAWWRVLGDACRTADRVTYHAFGFLFKVAVVAYFVFCALFLTLRHAVLPNIDRYKTDVEQIATEVIGRPVKIATIHASWRGLRPYLILNNVAVYSQEGKQALSLPRVSATVSWWSVVTAELRLHSLEIIRPDVDIRRDAEGRFYVAGIPIDPDKEDDGKGADWVLSQREIVIRDGWVRWNDGVRKAPELALESVNFVLRNHGRNHRFALRAKPPAEFAAPIDVRGDFDHPHFSKKISDPTRWKGVLYADWRDTDLAVWKPYFNYPIDVYKGNGSIRAWLNFDRTRVADFTADLTLSDVSTRLRKDLEQLNLVRVNGRVSVHERPGSTAIVEARSFGSHGHTIALTNFSMETDDGLKLPTTTISESFTPRAGNRPERTEITATTVNLQALADFVERLPLSGAQRKLLTDFSPRGGLYDFAMHWEGAYPEISAYGVKGRFVGLSMKARAPRPAKPAGRHGPEQAALPGIPGFENLTGQVEASEKGGTINLASQKISLQLPGYFVEPVLPFDQLQMQARWSLHDKNNLYFQIDDMHFVREGLTGSLSSKHVMPLREDGEPALGTIDLSAKIDSLDITKVEQFLPLHTPQHLRSWLTGALQAGTARDVSVTLKGDLEKFPFQSAPVAGSAQGVFLVSGRIENGRLNYAPGELARDGKSPMWPVLDEITGSFVMDRARLEIRGDKGKTHGVSISDTKAVIPDLLAADGILEIDGHAAGPLKDFLRYANDSPVSEWIARFTEDTTGTGDAALHLKLQLPLTESRMPDAKVQGRLQFSGNDIVLQSGMPPMLGTTGELKFHEKGFELGAIKANFLGGATTVSGGSQRNGNIAVKAEGSISADGLRKTYPASVMQRLFRQIVGTARYVALINIRNKRPEIVIESTLQGMGLDFPSPLRKAAGETLPFRFELAGQSAVDAPLMQDEIKLSLGTSIAARYHRQKTAEKNSSWRVVRGGIGVNVPIPQPDAGVVANVSLRTLNLDSWRNTVAVVLGTDKQREKGGSDNTPGFMQYIDPDVLAARATELYLMGKKLDNVVVGASHQNGVWQANVDSEQASGYVTWLESISGRGLGRVTARLASLIIPQSAVSDVTELLEGKNGTTQMPSLDIVAENFQLFGKKLGHLELQASNISPNNPTATPGAREWRIRKLSIANPDAEFKATGKWTTREGESITNLNYELALVDAGKLLDRLGFVNVLKGGKGKMDGDISWKGLPFLLDIPSLSGQLHMDVTSGQFTKVDPGAAKLLGVLSMQSLKRRLSLDFRDILNDGLAFDGIVATASIKQGIARTDNFKMRSPGLVVLMDGTVDIAKESQNLHVAAIPDLNASGPTLLYGLAVNPVIGLGAFLAQLVLRDPLARALTVEYQISGGWKEPAVTKLERPKANPASVTPAAANVN